MNKKTYTREEKIEYWTYEMIKAKRRMQYAEARLEFIKSDKYQDWNSELQKQLEEKKRA